MINLTITGKIIEVRHIGDKAILIIRPASIDGVPKQSSVSINMIDAMSILKVGDNCKIRGHIVDYAFEKSRIGPLKYFQGRAPIELTAKRINEVEVFSTSSTNQLTENEFLQNEEDKRIAKSVKDIPSIEADPEQEQL